MVSILVLGTTGMLGHKLFITLSKQDDFDVYGSVRETGNLKRFFVPKLIKKIHGGIYADQFKTVEKLISLLRPDLVINCIGLVKQLPESNDPIKAITINSLFPHMLANICYKEGSRLIHFSTDCVFDGKKGNYKETDYPDAKDLYGKSKYLGEVCADNCLTLRTSIIGHELFSKKGLVEWFLSQTDMVYGYTKAFFSGFPTLEIANILAYSIIPSTNLCGLYHISSKPISKNNLLYIISNIYKKRIKIVKKADVKVNRSLNSSKFRNITGYVPPDWEQLIGAMYEDSKNV